MIFLIFTFVSGSNRPSHMASSHITPTSQHFAHHQASGYSPALQRKKNSSFVSNSGRLLGWMTEPAAPSAATIMKDRDFQLDKHLPTAPQSILVKPDMNKNSMDKVMPYL